MPRWTATLVRTAARADPSRWRNPDSGAPAEVEAPGRLGPTGVSDVGRPAHGVSASRFRCRLVGIPCDTLPFDGAVHGERPTPNSSACGCHNHEHYQGRILLRSARQRRWGSPFASAGYRVQTLGG